MAKDNVNIAQKLLAYIHHGVDITPEIKDVYRNSLIFIGDEKRIYVPAMNTYVGIGMTSYTNTVDAVDALAARVNELAQTLASDSITRMYVDWNWENHDMLTNQVYTEEEFNKRYSLSYQVTLRGTHDYDPSTGFSYLASQKNYIAHTTDGIVDAKNGSTENGLDYLSTYSSSYLATSGITITPHWASVTYEVNSFTGESVERRHGNWIEIDDKLTWSYMTSAYAYSMQYAQKYTDSAVEEVYHNLLGESEDVFAPVSFDTVFEDITDYVNGLSDSERKAIVTNGIKDNAGNLIALVAYHKTNRHGSAITYVSIDKNANYFIHSYNAANGVEQLDNREAHFAPRTGDDATGLDATALQTVFNAGQITATYPTGDDAWVLYDADDTPIANFPQLYSKSTVYNSSYNMNIKDGIQTLKEVAYLLDVLTDGMLGQTTYLTWNDIKDNADLNDVSSWTDGKKTIGEAPNAVTYTSTEAGKNQHPADNDIVAFYTKPADADNIGIQMAYSIAGNQMQIDDLHKHAELAEKGETTLRSIQATGEYFGAINLQGGTSSWTNTDTNQTDELNWINAKDGTVASGRQRNSYLVGDVNLVLDLNTAYTYVTYNSTFAEAGYYGSHTSFGEQWYGEYVAADMKNLKAGIDYYVIDQTAADGSVTFTKVDNPELDWRSQNPTDQYYWIPVGQGSTAASNNPIFTSITKSDWMSAASTDTLAGTTITKAQSLTNGLYSEKDLAKTITDPNDPDLPNSTMFYFVSGYNPVEYHAYIPSENQLATTSWVSAYVVESLESIAEDLEDILTKAMQYTDKRIGELDSEHIYSDFGTYWASYVAGLDSTSEIRIEGSEAYNTAYNKIYGDYKEATRNTVFDGDYDATNNPYRMSYQMNSKYIYNVKEEDGIVTAEERELPSDRIVTSYTIWGDERNLTDERFKFAEVELPANGKNLFDALYDWTNVHGNELFVESTEQTMQAIDVAAGMPTGDVYFIDKNGNYTLYGENAAEIGLGNVMTDYSDVNDAKWKQLYRLVNRHLEIDLTDNDRETDATNDPSSNLDPGTLKLGVYTLTKSGANVTVTGGTAIANAKLLYISELPTAKKVEYLTGESKHFNFEENGNGENELRVKANIVRLEDAAADNSGFADAWDVKSWVINYLTMVDISATISADATLARPIFYKQIALADRPAGATLYDGTTTMTSVSDVKTAYYWADTLAYIGTSTPDAAQISLHANMNPTGDPLYYFEQFNKGNNTEKYSFATHNYYIRVVDAKTNTQNLTETQYGTAGNDHPKYYADIDKYNSDN